MSDKLLPTPRIYATISGNTLTVNSSAPNGAKINVKATAGETTSNTITVTVVNPLSALSISSDKSGEVDRGSFINLTVTKTPDDSTDSITWVVVEGGENATVVENKLFINDDTMVGTGTPNTSEIIYPGFQAGGIINARDLPTDGSFDTTHEYIELDVQALGHDAGKAYFYNHNYVPAN